MPKSDDVSLPERSSEGTDRDLDSLRALRNHLEEAAATAVAIQEHTEQVALLGATMRSTLLTIDAHLAAMGVDGPKEQARQKETKQK